jgi:hypothetical protein
MCWQQNAILRESTKQQRNTIILEYTKLIHVKVINTWNSTLLSEDGTPVPQHVAISYSLYFIVFWWMHLLVNTVNASVCTAQETQNFYTVL